MEAVGKAFGDAARETEGKFGKAEGKIRHFIGGVKDAVNKK